VRPLALPIDAGSLGDLCDAAPAADASGTEGGHAARDGASGNAVAPDDSGADGSAPEAGAEAATPPIEAGPDGAGVDASPYPSCTSIAISWVFGFDSDPTKYDGNGDGIPDWTVRE
jgi:hypothetical protein